MFYWLRWGLVPVVLGVGAYLSVLFEVPIGGAMLTTLATVAVAPSKGESVRGV